MPIVETCTHPQCFNPRPCSSHPPNKDTKTADERKFYGSQRWRETSERHRKQEPFCRQCQSEGRISLAAITDHITPIRQGGARWDASNFQSLCRRCDQQKRRRER